jgi:hypothetical protein
LHGGLLFGGDAQGLLSSFDHPLHVADTPAAPGGAVALTEDLGGLGGSRFNRGVYIPLADAVAIANVQGGPFRLDRTTYTGALALLQLIRKRVAVGLALLLIGALTPPAVAISSASPV